MLAATVESCSVKRPPTSRAQAPRPTRANRSESDQLRPTENEMNRPIISEATSAPSSEPSPPTTTTTNTSVPKSTAMFGPVGKNAPATAPASPASAAPAANTLMKTTGRLWPSASTMTGR